MKVSVVIPVFNQADFVGDAIRSVLGQTHSELEAIVVNDASTDSTGEVLASFHDPRLKVVAHQKNRGLSAARNTGIRAASGDLIAFLDGDDIFHKEKIAAHIDFMQTRPEIGVSYNSRYELNHDRVSVRELWRAPATCGLDELVRGFPFAPSDMVVRKDWLKSVGLFDESLLYFSEDLEINCRLALAGCRFASVNKALNCRRYYSRRVLKVRERLQAALGVLDKVFADPRCPAEVLASRDVARAAHYLVWSFYAFSQDDGVCGREFLRSAVRLDPAQLRSGVLRQLMLHCAADENCALEAKLRRIVGQFPPELRSLGDGWVEASAQGYLLRGVRAAIWGNPEEAEETFARAFVGKAPPSQWLVGLLSAHLLDVRELLGDRMAEAALRRVERLAKRLFPTVVKMIKACYFFNSGLRNYQTASYYDALKDIGRAVANNCSYAGNRGLLSITLRSAWRMLPRPARKCHAATN